MSAHPVSAGLLIQSLDPGPLPVLSEGLEGEERGQQAFNPGLRCGSSISAWAELQQEAPYASSLALVDLLPGGFSSALLCSLPGSPHPQHGQWVLEQPSQHNQQGGKEESHQTQPAQLLELHHRLLQPLIPSGPDVNIKTVSRRRSAPLNPEWIT